MIRFSQNAVNAIKQGKLSNYKGDLQRQLETYTSFDHQGNHLLFLKLKALIQDIVHNIDVVDQMLKDNIV
jgi:dynein heavy chain 2